MQRCSTIKCGTTWCHLRYLSQSACVMVRRNILQFLDLNCYRCSSSGGSNPEPAGNQLNQRRPEIIMNVFNRKAKRMQRDRSALAEDHSVYDYLKDEFGYRLADRICDIKRKFAVAVELGCSKGHASKNIYSDMVDLLYQCELSQKTLELSHSSPEVPTYKIIGDEEFFPFKDNSLELVFSNISLHWVNDLPGCFRQVLNSLKNDGAFIGSMFGGDTLHELRVALQMAELDREGGFAPHISPFTDVQDLGNLLTRAGFVMLTIDVDEITVTYPTMYELLFDLKGMAENNCAWSRKSALHRDTMLAAAAIYQEMFSNEKGIPATFQVINFIGWKPDPSQPSAAKRGSGEVSLKDLDKIDQLTKQIEIVRSENETKSDK